MKPMISRRLSYFGEVRLNLTWSAKEMKVKRTFKGKIC
jgi:hypothetical protein